MGVIPFFKSGCVAVTKHHTAALSLRKRFLHWISPISGKRFSQFSNSVTGMIVRRPHLRAFNLPDAIS